MYNQRIRNSKLTIKFEISEIQFLEIKSSNWGKKIILIV